MGIFTSNKSKTMECQRLLTKIMNVNNPSLNGLREGPRGESRMDLTMVVVVVPADECGMPDMDLGGSSITKEISSSGMAVVLDQPVESEKVFVAFKLEGETKYVKGTVRHQQEMGAGFFHTGVELDELVTPRDYRGLEQIAI